MLYTLTINIFKQGLKYKTGNTYSIYSFSKTLWSQKVVLYELRVDARTNMENYIKFYATGVGGESLVFKTDYGTLSQYRDMLIYKTDKPGKVHFKVYRKQKRQIDVI